MTELGYKERAINFSTTNATLFATTGAGGGNPIIGNLDVTVVGTGAAVEVEFYCPAMGNTSAAIVTSYLVVNGAVVTATGQYKNWATSYGEGGSMRRRLVLTNAVSYTFTVGLSAAAGISTANGSATGNIGLMYLRVTD